MSMMPEAVTITGLPAVLIILLILALLIAGAWTLTRLSARGAKKVVGSDSSSDDRGGLG